VSVVIPFEKIPFNMLNPFLQHLRDNPDISMSSVRKVFDECVNEDVPEVNRKSLLTEQLSIYFYGLTVNKGESQNVREIGSSPAVAG